MKNRKIIFGALGMALLAVLGGMFLCGYLTARMDIEERVDRIIRERMEAQENYLVGNVRAIGEVVNRHADAIDRHQTVIDSLGVECEVNRACLIRAAWERDGDGDKNKTGGVR